MKLRGRQRGERGGFALIVVLLVLLALLVLTTPFLAAARNADRASSQLADRATARIGLDAAARHARSLLSETYPSADLDKTPYWDTLDEIKVDNTFDSSFLNANDAHGQMWDVELRDVAGLIDLNSASPQTIANLMGLSARFSRVISSEAKELPLSSSNGFQNDGFLWSEGELIRYSQLKDSVVTEFVRGMFGPPEKGTWRGGPRPSGPHGAGTPVLDQRAFAPCLWRAASIDGELRNFEALEELPQCGLYARALQLAGGTVAPSLPEELVRPLARLGTVYAGPRGGHVWQRAARVTTKIEAKKDGQLRIDNNRWLNPGSTVRIRDGQTTEIAIVQEVRGSDMVVLDRILDNDYEAYGAVLEVLARRPVNVNTAAREVLVAIFSNLQCVGHNTRITSDEASQLADLVIQSRPFLGFEDFLRRIVLPSAGIEKLPTDAPEHPDILAKGTGFIDPWDAVALYRNGLNANDAGLLYSTMPYSFTTRDTYAYALRSTVNAESGVERFALIRDEVAVVAPQKELLRLWARQEDFDEEMRLDCDAPWWATGPNSTTRYDNGSVPPSRMWAHLGTFEDQVYIPGVTDTSKFQDRESPPVPEHIFASRENQGYVQLMTTREDDKSALRKGRVMHFDNETRDLEGRYLPDQIVTRATDDDMVRWTAKDVVLCRPASLSMWIKPRALADSKFLDLGGSDSEVDRISLQIEGSDLVLRTIDGFGDHRDTPMKEAGELRYALSGANSPGLPVETWSHVEIDVRGNRPSQMSMLVNGMTHGVRTPGLTRLSGALAQGVTSIGVDSLEGFPATCVVRIGNELIEVQNAGGGKLDATRQETGKLAGFGGRTARERMQTLSEIDPMVPASLATIETDHPAGTPVELYGYSMPVTSFVPTGKAQLAGDLGIYRTAIVRAVEGGQGAQGDPITIGLLGFTIGNGMKAKDSQVTGLVLAAADDGIDTSTVTPPAQYMPAFHRDGGYAVLIQVGASQNNEPLKDNDGAYVGGMEIVRYSGWSDHTLKIAQADRALDKNTLPNLANLPQQLQNYLGGKRSFVVTWRDILGVAPPIGTRIENQLFVVPISLGVPGSGAVNGFLAAAVGNSQFAQITHVDDAENTEWVRYDYFDSQRGQLVRDDPAALLALYNVLVNGQPPVIPGGVGSPGGGGPGGGGGGGGPNAEPMIAKSMARAAPAPQTATPTGAWDPRIGKNENTTDTWAISRAVETTFQFRGVFGTYSHKHTNGAVILPVFRGPVADFDGGRPGRMDAIFLSTGSPDHPGWPLRVHRSYVPSVKYEVLAWKQPDGDATRPISVSPTTSTGTQATAATEPYLTNSSWIALQDKSPEPISPGGVSSNAQVTTVDSRLIARLSCFPSGERPRAVSRMAIGGGASGTQGAIPAAVVDEIVFGDAQFGRATPLVSPEDVAGATLFLTKNVDEGSTSIQVAPKAIRVSLSNIGSDHEYLADMPADAGLLRIGDEILAYKTLTAGTGDIEVANSGRGLLGSRAQAHEIGEPVMFLENHVVSVLSGALSAGDAKITLASTEDFPTQGTVLIGGELISYTRQRESALEMPRASSAPGKMDQKGDGLFRGRFGTLPAAHQAGEAVILFPTRYPDLWADRADAPELSYFGLSLDQPSAWFSACYFSKVDTQSARIGVLQRTRSDAPWDADPETDSRLAVFWQGEKEGGQLKIGKQADRLEWRIFVDYMPGAFDLKTGLPHGWKESPRLKLFSVFYRAPSLVLSSVER